MSTPRSSTGNQHSAKRRPNESLGEEFLGLSRKEYYEYRAQAECMEKRLVDFHKQGWTPFIVRLRQTESITKYWSQCPFWLPCLGPCVATNPVTIVAEHHLASVLSTPLVVRHRDVWIYQTQILWRRTQVQGSCHPLLCVLPAVGAG